MKKPSRNPNLLSSWKDIASYLDCDVRTARRWEKTNGLPVHRINQASKSRVHAYKDEIDTWLRPGDKVTPERISRKFNQGNKRLTYTLLGGTALILAVGLIMVLTWLPGKQPVDFRIKGSNLILLSKQGEEIWQFNTGFADLHSTPVYKQRFNYKKLIKNEVFMPWIIIRDLEGDGKNEVLFGISTSDQMNSGKLYLFDSKGTIRWSFDSARELRYGSALYSNNYVVHGIEVDDLNGDGSPEIIFISDQQPFFITHIVILDINGKLLGEYWNAGRIMDMVTADLNNDGLKEIILGGINNEYRKGCIVVLNFGNVRGGSPQVNKKYVCDQISKGTEVFYLLLPRTDVDSLINFTGAVNNLKILDRNKLLVMTKYSKIYYEFDSNLRLRDIKMSHKFEFMHLGYRREGKIHSELNDQYKKNLSENILYFNGTSWTKHHSVSNNW